MTPSQKMRGQHLRGSLPHVKHSGKLHSPAGIISRLASISLLAVGLFGSQACTAQAAVPLASEKPLMSTAETTPSMSAPGNGEMRHGKMADFAQEKVSAEARYVADWIIDSNDSHALPFIIVDKKNTRVFVFDGSGQIKGAAAALLGIAIGDESTPGIGQRKLSDIRVEERTTPAGRFVATLGHNIRGKEILWVDYEAAISLHRVITSNPKEQRAERLASLTSADNRISFGCINVPVMLYEQVVSPLFRKANGIVYVLSETRTQRETFGAYDVDERARLVTPVAGTKAVVLPDTHTIKLR